MPRRLLTAPDHDRRRALHIAVWWIETFTVHGPGDVQGEPSVLVDEYADFVVDCYALDASGRRLYDSAFFSRPKGCDKSGLAAKLVLFEAFGPCRFAGFAKGGETYEFLGHVYTYRKGEAMGRAVQTPYIRIMATEEGQTGNVYDTVYFNLSDPERAPLYAMRAYGCDVGLTRILLPDGGEITPSTAGASSKDGGKETFVVFDESHLYKTPQLRQMYSTVTRNTRKRKKIAGTWYLETTTMYAPGEDSVAEETYRLADAIQEGKARRNRLLFDHRWGECEDFTDEAALRKAVAEAYGDALLWNDLEGIIDGILDPRELENDSRRYFLNALFAARNAWLTPAQITYLWNRSRDADFVPLQKGDTITLGFDGSRTDDATALIACRVSDRFLFPLHIQEIPDGPEAEGWQVDRDAVDAAVFKAFETYDVVAFYGDPPFWQDYLDAWNREYGNRLYTHATKANSIEWWTNRPTPMTSALERFHTAMTEPGSTVRFQFDDKNPLTLQLKRHFANARVWPRREGYLIGKERRGGPLKIDGAMAATLAFEAAADYAANPRPARRKTFVPIRVR